MFLVISWNIFESIFLGIKKSFPKCTKSKLKKKSQCFRSQRSKILSHHEEDIYEDKSTWKCHEDWEDYVSFDRKKKFEILHAKGIIYNISIPSFKKAHSCICGYIAKIHKMTWNGIWFVFVGSQSIIWNLQGKMSLEGSERWFKWRQVGLVACHGRQSGLTLSLFLGSTSPFFYIQSPTSFLWDLGPFTTSPKPKEENTSIVVSGLVRWVDLATQGRDRSRSYFRTGLLSTRLRPNRPESAIDPVTWQLNQ